MTFILLTFLAAFAIEGLGTLVSVIGLSTLFGANPIIIALAVALDAGKLVVVTLLYSYWNKLGKLMKSYALIAATITMIITSAGAAGYLSGEFQKAIMGTQEVGLKVDVLKQEQAKLEARKKQIDDSIAAIPDRYTANQKIRLMNQFKEEQKQVTARLNQISEELPKMQIDQIGVEAKAGPILYIAKAFDIPVESAVKWVILMIIFVFDPLAVFLIIAGNFLLHQHRLQKGTKVTDADLFEEPKAPSPEVVATKLAVPKFNDDLASDANAPIGSPEWDRAMAGIDEPGVGNSVVKFDEQYAAMPPELKGLSPYRPYPDASQTRTYTRQDLIDLGASDNTLIEAGYQPREQATPEAPETASVVEPSAPIFEEHLEDPGVADDGAGVKTYDDTLYHTEWVDDGGDAEREIIRLEDVTRPAAIVHRSSLNSVKADDTMTFDQNPRDAISGNHYRNLR